MIRKGRQPVQRKEELTEKNSIQTSFYKFDTRFRKDYSTFAGIDEAGRGPIAGPLVAAAVCIPPGIDIPEVNDSKKLASGKRRICFHLIEKCCRYGIGMVSPAEIDEYGMTEAVRLSFTRAVLNLSIDVSLYIIDGLHVKNLPFGDRAKFIVKGDTKSLAIASAGIVAKVTRDEIMTEMETKYPGYGFASHKGYCTRTHLEALDKLGPTPIHRFSFAPLKTQRQMSFRFE